MSIVGLRDRRDHSAKRRCFCSGSVRIYNRQFMCWKKGGHGTVDVHKALVHSCNVFYYLLGKKVGIDAISEVRQDVRHRASCRGSTFRARRAEPLRPPTWKQRVHKEPWYPGDTISVSIGQGLLARHPGPDGDVDLGGRKRRHPRPAASGCATHGWKPRSSRSRRATLASDPRRARRRRRGRHRDEQAQLGPIRVAGKTGHRASLQRNRWASTPTNSRRTSAITRGSSAMRPRKSPRSPSRS